MAAYIWVETTAHNPSQMKNYYAKVAGTVSRHGGRQIIVGGDVEVLEGSVGQHATKVLLEFDSAQAARNWYQSPEYQEILTERHANATTNMLIVEGVAPAG